MRTLISIILLCTATSATANTCGRTTQVEADENYGAIALRCDVTVDRLFAQNPRAVATDLSIGQIINIDNSGDVLVQTSGDYMGQGDHEYLTEFLGAYSPKAICSGQEIQLDLTPDTVTFGETRCDIKTVIYDGERQVAVNLGSCNAEGELVPDRFVNLSWFEDEMTYEYAAAYSLVRCTDR